MDRQFQPQGAVALSPDIHPAWFQRLQGREREFFAPRLDAMRQQILQAQQDGLDQLVPVIVAMADRVETLRDQLGKAVWRRIHHATETANFMRALLWIKHGGAVDWADIVAIPTMHLRSCRNAPDWPSAYFASLKAPEGKFAQAMMLYRDTVKMGGKPDLTWSLRRLRKTHDRLGLLAALESVSATPWAEDFEVAIDGFVFQRLVSDRDFTLEGRTQRHCVATYRQDAQVGACIVMRCTGAERATLRFGGRDGFEMKGFANGEVSPRCIAAARLAQNAFEGQKLEPTLRRQPQATAMAYP